MQRGKIVSGCRRFFGVGGENASQPCFFPTSAVAGHVQPGLLSSSAGTSPYATLLYMLRPCGASAVRGVCVWLGVCGENVA